MGDTQPDSNAIAGVRFNAIVIVESLPAGEVKTGEILDGFVTSLVVDLGLPVKVAHRSCGGVIGFKALLAELTDAARSAGLLPILHVEAHGSRVEGLHFADDSVLPWPEFCRLITPLNLATGFQLMVVVSACYGISLIDGVKLSQAAPCLVMMGPTDEVDPAELMGRFRAMYRAMLKTGEAGPTIDALLKGELAQGGMIYLSAPRWFDLLMSHYLQHEATPRQIKDFALRHERKARAEGIRGDKRYFKRLFREELRPVIREYFERYFMYADLPKNRSRFDHHWPAIEEKIRVALSR